ncbi:hypothetical protein BGW36DRAFT_308759 [Talaromyces proteolyticus]|uniref:Amidohydrolase-related domain-containing protein n=1 Tax=Talaromyces proteolyticus TaxID=1131652 RepID=A0AAD4KJ46_9EURO|nr:uncharacterized protein BGW36DRAFT_308759 [Talaromyces proteolyticus]KAH8689498.1 hypothetical protein BGW36DRAFT_308759 [Talaromyces proteolyticus]
MGGSIGVGLLGLVLSVTAQCSLSPGDSNYRIDVHSHAVPDVWRAALVQAGYPVKNGTLYTDGFPVSNWTLEGHLEAMTANSVNYTTLSISAPGVTFLAHDATKAKNLARKVNLAMHQYTQQHPEKLGAMCLLPLPHVKGAIAEIKFCLDTLGFDGVGMYTNSNGTYLGDSSLDPIFELLQERNATVFVHPAAPGCESAGMGWPSPMTEYPFDSVRAMENMLLSGQRASYPNVTMIFPHGGGAMPYLATRIAGMSSLPFLGGLSVPESLAQLAGYYFDTASATSAIQLNAMKSFIGIDRILIGTDYPYVPVAQSEPALAAIQTNGNFTSTEMAQINSKNTLSVFPRISAKLGW